MPFKPIQFIKNILGNKKPETHCLADFESFHTEIIEKVRLFTMTNPERLFTLIESIKYIVANQIPGA